jgi:hypothetical protein
LDERLSPIYSISTLGAKKRKTTVPTTRHIPPVSTINETNPLSNSISESIEYLSPELPLPEESTLSVTNDIPIESSNDQITYSIVATDDDDMMPIVASVEEEQPIEDSTQSEIDTTFVIVESTDCSDEKIQLDDTIPSCSSGYESSAILNNIDNNNIHEGDDNETNSTIRSRQHSSSCPSIVAQNSPMISSTNQKKVNKKRQRNKYGKSRARTRSLTPRNLKKQRQIDDDDDDESSLVIIITSDKIEQHLRTLFMVPNESRRTRTRPVKTPTRLVEEINANNTNNSMKTIEPDTNVFDILSSPTPADTESTENPNQSCTYNVVISTKPNKLGLTIKKVAQS